MKFTEKFGNFFAMTPIYTPRETLIPTICAYVLHNISTVLLIYL